MLIHCMQYTYMMHFIPLHTRDIQWLQKTEVIYGDIITNTITFDVVVWCGGLVFLQTHEPSVPVCWLKVIWHIHRKFFANLCAQNAKSRTMTKNKQVPKHCRLEWRIRCWFKSSRKRRQMRDRFKVTHWIHLDTLQSLHLLYTLLLYYIAFKLYASSISMKGSSGYNNWVCNLVCTSGLPIELETKDRNKSTAMNASHGKCLRKRLQSFRK